MDVVGMGEGIGSSVYVWRMAGRGHVDPAGVAPTSPDAGQVGRVSLSADLAQTLVDQVGAAIAIVRGDSA